MVDLIIRRRARRWLAPFLLVLACGYFTGHGVAGRGGLSALMETRADIALLEARLERLREERASLEDVARRLDPEAPDLDLMSEIIRKRYGYVRPGETILPMRNDRG